MNKIGKIIIEFICTSILSLLLLFVVFEAFSQYHFGDVPTPVVKAKLLFGYIILEGMIYFFYKIIKRKR